jgi:hypothetical protein
MRRHRLPSAAVLEPISGFFLDRLQPVEISPWGGEHDLLVAPISRKSRPIQRRGCVHRWRLLLTAGKCGPGNGEYSEEAVESRFHDLRFRHKWDPAS